MITPARKTHYFIIIFILFCSIFMINSAAIVVSPILKFLQKDLAFSEDKYGIVISVYPIVSFFFGLILGPVTDQYDKKKTLLFALLGMAVMLFLTGTATQLGLWMFFRGFTGIFGVLTAISVFSYILDYFTGEDRVKVMGFVLAAVFLAANLSSSAAVFIAGVLNWHYIFYFSSALSLIILFLSFFFLPVPDVKLSGEKINVALYKERLFSIVRKRDIAVLMLVYFTVFFGIAVLRDIYPTWLFGTFAEKNVTYIHVSYLFLFGGIGGIAGSVFSGYLAAKVSDKMIYIAVMISLLGIFSLMTPFATQHIWQQFLIIFCIMTAGSLQMPVFRTVIIGSAEPRERGSVTGLLNSLTQLANATGAYAGTGLYIMDNTLRLNGYCTVAILLYSSVLIWKCLRRQSC